MNLQEYITSGIVESYVLGLASNEERAEFEKMCSSHNEIRAARESFELSLEEHAMMNAVQPSKNIKSKIFSEIEIEEENSKGNLAENQEYKAEQVDQDTRRMAPVVRMPWVRYLAAASVVLLIASTALNFYFFSQYKEYSGKYGELLASQQQLAANNQSMQVKLQEYQNAFSWLKDPNMAIVKMPAVPTSPNPGAAATVYWDTQSKDVYLLVNNLPKPSSTEQYQLWALVDGQPVDAGVFDVNDGATVARMKNIPRAQAFAVTLEKKGGSAAPTMEKMYVMGKV